MTTCLLISSAAKQRCETKSRDYYFIDGAIHKESCVTDEKFRVRYKIQNGQMITSFIETSGQKFPRLMEVNISLDFRQTDNNRKHFIEEITDFFINVYLGW